MADFDLAEFKRMQDHGQNLKATYSQRNSMLDAMERMFLMTWDDESRVAGVMQNVKVTKSPDARNAIMGALRLLIATEPSFSMPAEFNPAEAQRSASKVEKAASALLQAAGRVRRKPVRYDVVLSMLLAGESYIAVTRTADLVAYASKGGKKAAILRAEEIAFTTPYLFDVWDARTCYPEMSSYGMSALYREVETRSGLVLDEYGQAAIDAGMNPQERLGAVTLCHYWDFQYRVSWVLGSNQPLVFEEHGLPFIPVVGQIGEGSQLFSKAEDQRQPFLYTLWRSGMWDRQNLALTVYYTLLFAMGANPMYYERIGQPGGRHLEIDYSVPGGRVTLGPGDEYGQVASRAIDPAVLESLSLSAQKIQESTIFSQALGQPLGGNAPYSMVALLHQAGRLPLITPQQAAEFAIADAVKIAIRWMKLEPSGYTGGEDALRLTGADVPKQFELQCKLDVALPQDKLQAANIANMLTQGGTVSQSWVRENVLNINQPEEMQKAIWTEQAANAMFGMFVEQQMQAAQAQAAAQAAMNTSPGAGGPMGAVNTPLTQPGAPMEQPQPGGGGGLPPEMMGLEQPGQMPGQGDLMPPGGGGAEYGGGPMP